MKALYMKSLHGFWGRCRSRIQGMPLRHRLPASFGGVALLTMLGLGAILLPLLNSYYTRSEVVYLEAGGAVAADDLSIIDWGALAEGNATAAEISAAMRHVQAEALSLQLRIQVLAADGTLLADSGPVREINPSGVVGERSNEDEAVVGEGRDSPGRESLRSLPNPVGSGLFGIGWAEDLPRSDRTMDVQLTAADELVATLRLSEAPAYGAAVLGTTLIAWLVAGAGAVILAALVGWLVSRRLTRPLLAITAASDAMAKGDLSVRAPVERADEVGSLARSFNAMAETTERTVSTLRRFVADAAHEIGTPLTALQSDLELAQDQTDEGTRERLIRRALQQAERIGHLSAGLLRLSRLETRTTPARMEPLDLALLVQRLSDSVASRAEQAGISLVLEPPAGEVWVRGQAEALAVAIENLLDNALKFTPAGGSVTLGLRREAENAVVWVEDSGIGVPASDLSHLFSRFHRGRNAAAYAGSGLGLAIVRATVQLHGGTVSVESPAPGAASTGSRFEMRLPLLRGKRPLL